uniref:catechol O-methyltransferase n=1 Tax=Araucaria cunninghamii TaxID=56994 RepID=A0A0D6QXZ3_ARACU
MMSSSGAATNRREAGVLQHVLHSAEKGNPQSVLDAMDSYAQQKEWLPNIGDEKGAILDAAVKRWNPELCLELGTFCGYSAIRIAFLLTHPHSKLFSLEIDPIRAQIARAIIDHAGLSSKVEIMEGTLSEQGDKLAEVLKAGWGVSQFGLVFVDHDKTLYLADFERLKNKRLIGTGSVIVTDNMKFEGSAAFLEYLRGHGEELETEEHMSHVEYRPWEPDMVTVSVYKAHLPQLNN